MRQSASSLVHAWFRVSASPWWNESVVSQRVREYDWDLKQRSLTTLPSHSDNHSVVRTLLILGRVSNLPTVWSNCLAGWLIAGGGEGRVFAQLCAGASLLYLGGMYLNDAIDAAFDRQHRPERPLPSGAISRQTVWILSGVWFGLGGVLLVAIGDSMTMVTVGLLACIGFYDLVHKHTSLAPLAMAGCRFLLYLAAGAATGQALTRSLLWAAGALALYVVGLSYVARTESKPSRVNSWTMPLLLAPLLVSALVGAKDFHAAVLWIVYLAWLFYSVHPLTTGARRYGAVALAGPQAPGSSEPARAGTTSAVVVSRLLAGMVLVDMLAVPGGPGTHTLAFALLFVSALILQRTVPAT